MSDQPVAGWHPAPDQPGQQRYWDGATWTDHYAPMAAAAPLAPKSGGTKWFLIPIAACLALVILAGIVGALAGNDDDGEKASSGASRTTADEPPRSESTDDEPESTAVDTTTAPKTTVPPTTAAPTTVPPTTAPAQAVVVTGRGDDVIDVTHPDGGGRPVLVYARHNGAANFVVNGGGIQLLVNAIGAYEGVTLLDPNGENTPSLEVMADGDWTIEFRPVGAARSWDSEISGRGDDVTRFTAGSGAVAWTHNGSANFIVTTYSGGILGFDLPINEIGPYQGTVLVEGGGALVVVQADGDWSARRE